MSATIKLGWFVLGLIWWQAAWALGSFAEDISALGADSVRLALLLSMVGGVAAVLRKVTPVEGKPNPPLSSVGFTVFKDLFSSGLAGLATFFACEAGNVASEYEAFLVTGAGYLGTVFLDSVFGAALDRFAKAIGVGAPKPEA